MKFLFSFFLFMISISSFAQINVCLDHWYNREINAKTGNPYHYLWTDTENSGFSKLGTVFVSAGAAISSLEKAPLSSDLAKVGIYIIVDPDTTSENPSPNYLEAADISVIKKWVKKGGVLVLMANDAPNCEFTHLNKLAGEFGIRFNPVILNPVTAKNYEMGAEVDLPNHPLFTEVKKIYMKEVASITVTGNATPVLKDKDDVFIAECSFGKGFVLAIGDPWLYNEYIDNNRLPEGFENGKAAENLVEYLILKAGK